MLEKGFLELSFWNLSGPMRVDINRQRLGDADRIGKLDRAAISKSCGDDVFCEIARGISGRAIDFCRVLARECAAAVRRRPAIGIDNDFPAGQAAIAVGAANHELASWVDVPNRLRSDPALRQGFRM